MMYANPLLIVLAINYTENVLHIWLLYVDSGLTYSISLLVNNCNCTVKQTEHTSRELSSPLGKVLSKNIVFAEMFFFILVDYIESYFLIFVWDVSGTCNDLQGWIAPKFFVEHRGEGVITSKLPLLLLIYIFIKSKNITK